MPIRTLKYWQRLVSKIPQLRTSRFVAAGVLIFARDAKRAYDLRQPEHVAALFTDFPKTGELPLNLSSHAKVKSNSIRIQDPSDALEEIHRQKRCKQDSLLVASVKEARIELLQLCREPHECSSIDMATACNKLFAACVAADQAKYTRGLNAAWLNDFTSEHQALAVTLHRHLMRHAPAYLQSTPSVQLAPKLLADRAVGLASAKEIIGTPQPLTELTNVWPAPDAGAQLIPLHNNFPDRELGESLQKWRTKVASTVDLCS